MSELEEVKRLCLAPVTEEAPYGNDPAASPEFASVRQIIGDLGDFLTRSSDPARKLDSAEEKKRWRLAIDDCVAILHSQGKDLRVICWLSGALVMIYGIRGLKTGFEIFRHFLTVDAEGLFPHSLRPRFNSLGWLGEFIEFAVAVYGKGLTERLNTIKKDEVETLAALYQELANFYAAANDAFQDSRYDFSNLKKTRDYVQSLLNLAQQRISIVVDDEEEADAHESEATDAQPAAAPAAQPRPEPAAAPAPTAVAVTDSPPVALTQPQQLKPPVREPAPASGAEAAAAVESPPKSPAAPPPKTTSPTLTEEPAPDKNTMIRELAALAFKLRTAVPLEPLAFRLLRLAKWSQMALPATVAKTKRARLTGPRHALRILGDREKRLAKNEALDQLGFLETCERWFNDYPLWLDLQCMICSIAESAGLSRLKEVVVEETTRFLQQVGESVLDLEFEDGTPFASASTKEWLRSLLARAAAPGSAPLPSKLEPLPLREAAPTAPAPLMMSAEKPATPADEFIQTRLRELAAGRAAECLKATAQRLAVTTQPLPRWRLLRLCGLAAAALPAKAMLAAAILRECRALAGQLSLAALLPAEFGEALLALRDLERAAGIDLAAMNEQDKAWLALTAEALRADAGAALLRELAQSGL